MASDAIGEIARRLAYAIVGSAADSAFDRWWYGKQKDAISDAARRGYEIFRTTGACAGCHAMRPAEAAFSDFEFHATGTVAEGSTDLGRMSVTGVEADRGRFRTPTLRNVALTAPYFHDGSAKTLADVIECTACIAEHEVLCVDRLRVPQFVAYPCECAP